MQWSPYQLFELCLEDYLRRFANHRQIYPVAWYLIFYHVNPKSGDQRLWTFSHKHSWSASLKINANAPLHGLMAKTGSKTTWIQDGSSLAKLTHKNSNKERCIFHETFSVDPLRLRWSGVFHRLIGFKGLFRVLVSSSFFFYTIKINLYFQKQQH